MYTWATNSGKKAITLSAGGATEKLGVTASGPGREGVRSLAGGSVAHQDGGGSGSLRPEHYVFSQRS